MIEIEDSERSTMEFEGNDRQEVVVTHDSDIRAWMKSNGYERFLSEVAPMQTIVSNSGNGGGLVDVTNNSDIQHWLTQQGYGSLLQTQESLNLDFLPTHYPSMHAHGVSGMDRFSDPSGLVYGISAKHRERRRKISSSSSSSRRSVAKNIELLDHHVTRKNTTGRGHATMNDSFDDDDESEKVYKQRIFVRYLQPPTPEPQSPILVRESQTSNAQQTPIIIRQQTGPKPKTPPPIIYREHPPPMPPKQQPITIIEKRSPIPPPRNIIIERLPPPPPKQPDIIIERWLPPKKTAPRQIIIERCSEFCPSNMDGLTIIDTCAPPVKYVKRYCSANTDQVKRRHRRKKSRKHTNPLTLPPSSNATNDYAHQYLLTGIRAEFLPKAHQALLKLRRDLEQVQNTGGVACYPPMFAPWYGATQPPPNQYQTVPHERETIGDVRNPISFPGPNHFSFNGRFAGAEPRSQQQPAFLNTQNMNRIGQSYVPPIRQSIENVWNTVAGSARTQQPPSNLHGFGGSVPTHANEIGAQYIPPTSQSLQSIWSALSGPAQQARPAVYPALTTGLPNIDPIALKGSLLGTAGQSNNWNNNMLTSNKLQPVNHQQVDQSPFSLLLSSFISQHYNPNTIAASY